MLSFWDTLWLGHVYQKIRRATKCDRFSRKLHSKINSERHVHYTVIQHWTQNWGGSWWCHQMETFFALVALCAGNSPVTGEFPAQRPVTRSFDASLICAWINGSVNNGEAGDLRRYRAHYDVIVMTCVKFDYYLKQPIPICKQKNTQIIFAFYDNCCNHLWASLLQYFGDCFM